MVILHTVNAGASLQSEETSYLKLRTGQHPEFFRIVLEGAGNIISKGTVEQKGENILVRFPGAVFTIQKERVQVTYKKDEETIIFSPGNFTEFRFISLNNPDRLVIDVYRRLPEKNLQTKKKLPAKKTPPKIKAIKTKPLVKTAKKQDETSKNVTAAKAPAKTKAKETKPLVKAAKKQDETSKNITAAKTPDQGSSDHISETDQFKKVRRFLESGTSSLALREIEKYNLNEIKSLASYHLLYGEIYEAMKEYLSATKHFNLAAIYADNNDQKERSLLKRNGAYLKLGFFYEAKSHYSLFINNFSSSRYIKEAHLGLAKSLNKINNFSKAIEHYEQAGPVAEALFGIANALQRLGKVNEASAAYEKALHIDDSYPDRSPETSYFLGENKRMTGANIDAKKILETIRSSPFRDRARISLGIIAMEETDIGTAMKYFRSASVSRDSDLRMEALINMAMALSKSGEIKRAISTLEGVRYEYRYSPLHDKALLELSRAYGKDGRLKESLAALKELAYSVSPPVETYSDLQNILLEASRDTEKEIAAGLDFYTLWKDFGKWLMDESRGQFLVQMLKPLKLKGGRPFLSFTTWLIENTSGEIKAEAAASKADFFVSLGDIELSEQYLEMAILSNETTDTTLRISAKIYHAEGDSLLAIDTLVLIDEFEKSDLDLLGNVLFDLKTSELQDAYDAIDFYEKAANRIGGDSRDYARLAEILYDTGRKDEALKYYEIAHQKGGKDEWTMYRIGTLTGLQEYELPREEDDKQEVYEIGIEGGKKRAEEMFGDLQKGDSILSNIAKAKLMEIDILNRVAKVF